MPVLYSFRRCPYAMRARLALHACRVPVELREVFLRDKPAAMLAASPKGTVPVLVLVDGGVIEESLDIMDWALAQRDREGWLDFPADAGETMAALISENDGPFKAALDRYKYPTRYADADPRAEREKAKNFLFRLEAQLSATDHLLGSRFSKADAAILPFIRQFAHVDREWFYGGDWPALIGWLDRFLRSDRFAAIMTKYEPWKSGTAGVVFGSAAQPA